MLETEHIQSNYICDYIQSNYIYVYSIAYMSITVAGQQHDKN